MTVERMTADASALPVAIGPYAVERVLGRGAMSVVYLAHCPQYGPVALKLLRAELLAGPEREASLARFRREAAVGMRLAHPNIVRVFGFGEADDSPYLAMELVRGRELRDHLADGEGEPLPLPQAVQVLRDVLEALGYAHRQGVVHRDVKPANIVLGADGAPMLTDFGIAREEESDITQAGELLGTPAFIAPELLAGQGATAASDQFSAGVVAYYLLTGRRPFSGTVAAVMQQILFQEPPAPSQINPGLSAAFDAPLLRALAKRPEARFADADAFAKALKDALRAAVGFGAGGARMGGGGSVGEPAGRRPTREDATQPPASASTLLDHLIEALRRAEQTALTERALAGIADALATASGAARQRLPQILEDEGLKPTTARLAALAPAPGAAPGRADFMLNVRLVGMLAAALQRLDGANAPGLGGAKAPGLGGAKALVYVETAAGRIGDAFRQGADLVNQTLDADDNPDVMRLTADFLRLDVLAMALEELDAKRELADVARVMAALVCRVMGKINDMLSACIHDNDGFARFGVSLMLNDVEDLIDIARRALEGGLIDATGGAGPRLDRTGVDGSAQVKTFIDLAASFADLSLGELRAGLKGGMSGEVFAAKLRPIAALYKFAARLPAENARDELAALTRLLHRQIAGFTLALAEPDAGSEQDRADRLTAIYEMAEELSWREIVAAALGLLRKIQKTDAV